MANSRYRVLLINPNSSKDMTENLQPLIDQYPSNMVIELFTAPSDAPKSINNEDDAVTSTPIIMNKLFSTIKEGHYDGYLVACYSHHPLVEEIRDIAPRGVYVTGIFEASIMTALTLTTAPSNDRRNKKKSKFGIVTTGTAWEEELPQGLLKVLDLDSLDQIKQFEGVESTGLNADELHTASPEIVSKKIKDATKRLILDRNVKVISLGCAGMSGLDQIVKEALVEELGEEESEDIFILDPVKAGLGMLENLLRSLPGQPPKENGRASKKPRIE